MQNAGPLRGVGSICGAQARAGRSAGATFLVGEKDYTLAAGQMRPLRNAWSSRGFRRSGSSRSSRWRSAPTAAVENGRDHHCPGKLPHNLSELDEGHPRLVHLAAVVVGASHSGVALCLRRNHCCARSTGEVSRSAASAQLEQDTRCAGHLVFVGTAAVYDAGLAGENAAIWKFSIPTR